MNPSVFKPSGRNTRLTKSMSDRSFQGKAIAKRSVVSIRCVSSSNGKNQDLLDSDKLQAGDIVEQVITADGISLGSPFAGGKSGLQRELKRLYSADQNLLIIKVNRGRARFSTARAYIALDDSSFLKKNYVLKSLTDASYVVAFHDATEDECLALQEMRRVHMTSQLKNTRITKVDVRYAWTEKMKLLKGAGFPSAPLSMLVLPQEHHQHGVQTFGNVEDTVSRARSWLFATQESGVPISSIGMNTESLLIKVSGEKSFTSTVSSKHNFLSINTGMYGFEDYHGIDFGIVRAVRLWYTYESRYAEVDVVIKLDRNETRLGLSISRTREGFCYVSHVEEGTAADRAGLRNLFVASNSSGKLLVLTRIAHEKVIPWIILSTGSIQCFDTMSINQKLSLHRLAGQAAHFSLMATEGMMHSMQSANSEASTSASEVDRARYMDDSIESIPNVMLQSTTS